MSSVPNAISSVSSRFSGPQGPNFDRDLDRLFHVKIRPLLDAVDLLRGVLREEHSIQLPTIVVVGDQSSGVRQREGESKMANRRCARSPAVTHRCCSAVFFVC